MDNKTKNIQRKIKELITEQNMSQATLAYHAGISQPTLSNIMQGNHEPKKSTLDAIANALGVYTEYLSGDTPYRDFDHWLDMFASYDISEEQEAAVINMIKSWGYEYTEVNNHFVSVVSPNGQKKILCKWHLVYLLNNFFSMFDMILLPEKLALDEICEPKTE